MAQLTTYGEPSIRLNKGFQRFTATDAAANDSDKTITVPAARTWEITNIFVTMVASATVGNRQMTVIVADPAAVVLANVKADSVQTASTTEYYSFTPVAGIAVEAPAGYHYASFPAFMLDAGSTIRVYDSAAVDAAADDMTVTVSGRAY